MNEKTVDRMFNFLTQTEKVSSQMVQKSMRQYLPTIPPKHSKLFRDGKEQLEKSDLKELMLSREDTLKIPWSDVFTMFEGQQNQLSQQKVFTLIRALSPYGMPRKHELELVMQALDMDGDGVVGMDDFVNAMNRSDL